MNKITLAPWQLSLVAAIFIVLANNGGLFSALDQNLDLFSPEGLGFVLTIFLLLVFVLSSIFLLFAFGALQKAVIVVFLFASAIAGYFSNEMGIVFDEEMFLNIFATLLDRNSAEALELASLPLILHVLFLAAVPAALLGFVRITPRRLLPELGTRVLVTFVGFLLFAGSALANYKYVTYFAVEHRDLRFKVTPIFPVMSLVRLAQDKLHREPPFRVVDADAMQRKSAVRRTIGIMVVGEAARADHFSLSGYDKKTNPALELSDDLLFIHADSCGTSTIYSVPCMFSMRGRGDYAPSNATSESNVLDILSAAGIQTVWIDNNSSCKNVCDRIENVNLRHSLDESSPYFSDMGYYDEALLDALEDYLDRDGPDLLIVLHTLGSHGPAYSRRYPSRFGIFTPFCDKLSPKECSDEEVANAYDNTIVYTDYVLNQLIERLEKHGDDVDTLLFYASDHGESLGENGVYLHGLPYSIAPESQTNVPFIAWFSPQFRKDRGIDDAVFEALRSRRMSHDNVSHTLLGFYDVAAGSYIRDQDIFARPSLPGEMDAG